MAEYKQGWLVHLDEDTVFFAGDKIPNQNSLKVTRDKDLKFEEGVYFLLNEYSNVIKSAANDFNTFVSVQEINRHAATGEFYDIRRIPAREEAPLFPDITESINFIWDSLLLGVEDTKEQIDTLNSLFWNIALLEKGFQQIANSFPAPVATTHYDENISVFTETGVIQLNSTEHGPFESLTTEAVDYRIGDDTFSVFDGSSNRLEYKFNSMTKRLTLIKEVKE